MVETGGGGDLKSTTTAVSTFLFTTFLIECSSEKASLLTLSFSVWQNSPTKFSTIVYVNMKSEILADVMTMTHIANDIGV